MCVVIKRGRSLAHPNMPITFINTLNSTVTGSKNHILAADLVLKLFTEPCSKNSANTIRKK